MKIKSLMYVLMGTMLVTTSCSDNELEKGNDGSGTVDPVNASALVNVYSDKSGSEASLLVGDVLVKDSHTLTLNVPAACEKVYMKYNTVSGTEATKEFALSPVSRGVDQSTGFNFETNRLASVTLALPEDAVQPTNETDQGYLFYHNTGVVMFEDGWPIQLDSWYDEDFNDVVFEYDLKVTECHSQQMMETVGGKEELLLTLDVRAVGGIYPTVLGVVLDGLKSEYVDRITASLVLKDFYQITYKNGQVSGVPIYMVRASEAYERIIPNWDKDMLTKMGVEMRAYFDLMKRIAVAYNNAANPVIREEMKKKFLAMYDHITDQGVAYGSCWGNIHHYGYSVRGLYLAYFLMKDVLRETGKLQEAERTLRWYAITNEVYPKPEVNGIDMDSFNTQTTGRIASILMMEDTPEKLQYLRSFSRWIDFGCRPALGLSGSFKVDGGAFHHRNNYPAYAVGGLDGATNMIYLFSRTEFAVSELAHETVKNVLLTMRFYCNKLNFPLSMSGRHPDGKGKLVPMHFAMMALAGSPDGKEEYDSEMASSYLRLISDPSIANDSPEYMPKVSNAEERKVAKLLIEKGFRLEPDPQGNIAMGYGCVSVQRRSNWSAVARGHSRYLWAAEHYLGANLYGRYLAHGSLQILTAAPGQTVTPATSGWQQEGFDWNRIPGVTSIHLPLEQLQAKVLNVDSYSGMEEMLYSDEAFAGGLSQQKMNGNFGMKLHEHDKYNGSHRARKSYHFIDGMIVCLGSDIENTNTEFPTETTIFQLAVTDKAGHDYWKNYQGDKKVWVDHLGTGYYVPTPIRFEKNFPQYSRMQNTGKETKGDWVSLVVDYGKAPKNGSYEYAVLPQTNETLMKKFAKKPTYKVLQQDRNAHIVESVSEQIISYVLFETPETTLPGGLLQRVDTSCLVMIHKGSADKIKLTVAQPDLALYRGPSDEAFDKDGKRIERSIYSRPWIENASSEIPVTVTIKGQWNVEETPFCKVISSDKKQTVLQFSCKDGASFEVELRR